MIKQGDWDGLTPDKKNPDYIIAHWNIFAPNRSGMYETVKDLIRYENMHPDVLAGMVDPDKPEGGQQDGWLVTQTHNWALKIANVHLVHYRETPESALLKPKIFMIHGTIEACIQSEMTESSEMGKSFTSSLSRIRNCEATLVFNKRSEYFWKQFDSGNKVRRVTKGIDLDRFSPRGTSIRLEGKPVVGYGEVWRNIKYPLHVFYACQEYYKKNPHMRFQPYGASQYWRLWHRFLIAGNFFPIMDKHEMKMEVDNPANWLRGFDMLISPVESGEPSRVLQEALACGRPTIAWDTNPYKDALAYKYAKYCDINDLALKIEETWNELQEDRTKIKKQCREMAEKNYDAKKMAEEVLNVIREVVDSK